MIWDLSLNFWHDFTLSGWIAIYSIDSRPGLLTSLLIDARPVIDALIHIVRGANL